MSVNLAIKYEGEIIGYLRPAMGKTWTPMLACRSLGLSVGMSFTSAVAWLMEQHAKGKV